MYSINQARVVKFGAFLLLLGIICTHPQVVWAQDEENPWSDPYNLSKSGSTTSPTVVVDSSGVIHAVWDDNFAGYMYSSYQDDGWTAPKAVNFPFNEASTLATRPITLLSDDEGLIHAYWIGQDNDFYHGSVAEEYFGSSNAWNFLKIDSFVSGFDIALDDQGDMHIAYVKSQDEEGIPAGIYYQQLKNGFGWSPKQSIYLSPYFRSEEEVTHHVDISTTSVDEASRVFLGWDDPAQNQVSMRISDDDGENWDDPQVVAGTGGSTSSGRQFGLLLSPQGENILAIWQTGVPEQSCTISYVLSTDGGVSWSEPQPLLGTLPGCPSENQFFESSDGTVILMTTILNQIYLLAWNGDQWSEPRVQDVLSGFNDSVTNSVVTLSCRRTVLDREDILYHTGCDPEGTGDVWILTRAIGSVAEWFPPDPIWTKPALLASHSLGIFMPVSVTDSTGRVHVFWTQEDQLENGGLATRIYYTSESEGGWLIPVNILDSPDGEAEGLQVAIDSRDRLLLVWNGHLSGEIYFSWASVDDASNKTEWEEPITLPLIKPLNTSPTIIASRSDDIFVAYALPLNEDRGIYLIHSTDGGETWSSPSLALDAVAADFNMVDKPLLAQTESGRLHLLFTKNALPGDRNPIALYYVASDDNGVTWSQPIPMVERPIEWFKLINPAFMQVHSLWQELYLSVSSIFETISEDDGTTWEDPFNITNFGGLPGLADVVSDPAGRLQLVQILDAPAGGKILKHWTRDGNNWSVQDDFNLTSLTNLNINYLDAVVTNNGQLIVVYVTEDVSLDQDQLPYQILYSERTITLPLVLPTQTVVRTPTPQPTPTSTPVIIATEEPLPTARPTPTAGQIGLGRQPLNTSMIGLIAGWLLVMIIVSGAFIFELRRRKK